MMKHTLEKLLERGRSFFTPSETKVVTNSVTVAIDYKTILMSNYVSKRVHELSGRELEISFIYGGSVTHSGLNTKIDIKNFYVPPRQTITPSYFSCDTNEYLHAARHFAKSKVRIVGLGHSHSSFDVFHSGTDLDNYKNMTAAVGINIDHPRKVAKRYSGQVSSLAKSWNKYVVRPENKISTPSSSSVLPSLVFNAKGKCVDSILAVKSYTLENNRYKTDFSIKDCQLKVYNKNAVLTSDEMKSLDYMVQRVLSYNRMRSVNRGYSSDNVNKAQLALAS